MTNNRGEIIAVFSTPKLGNNTIDVQTEPRKDPIVE
jgi:hypothetical protein